MQFEQTSILRSSSSSYSSSSGIINAPHLIKDLRYHDEETAQKNFFPSLFSGLHDDDIHFLCIKKKNSAFSCMNMSEYHTNENK